MKNEYFIDNISDETLIDITDKILKFEKNKKSKNITFNLLKIVPVAAAVLLVIGLINILPVFITNVDVGMQGIGEPDVSINLPVADTTEKIDLFLPEVIEKSFFEKKILANITNEKDIGKIKLYYFFVDSEYVLDPQTTKREKDIILNILGEYTNLTRNDMIQMCIDNDLPYDDPNAPDPYPHVRFGEDRNTLLLDVVWYTDEDLDEFTEYLEIKWFQETREHYEEVRNSDYFKYYSDKQKEEYNDDNLENYYQRDLKDFKNGTMHFAKSVNGKKMWYLCSDPPKYTNSDGYIPKKVYPYDFGNLTYWDENGAIQSEFLGIARSKRECDRILKNKLIPLCDDLLARGLITQENYEDWTTFDPLDYYVNLWF